MLPNRTGTNRSVPDLAGTVPVSVLGCLLPTQVILLPHASLLLPVSADFISALSSCSFLLRTCNQVLRLRVYSGAAFFDGVAPS